MIFCLRGMADLQGFDPFPPRTAASPVSLGVLSIVGTRLSGLAAKCGATLACACFVLAQPLQSSAQEPGAADAEGSWYLALAAGGAHGGGLKQEGWNRDNLCYPTMFCFGQDTPSAISGYRWRYDIDLDRSAALELSAGRRVNRARVELSLGRLQSNAEQVFTGLSFYDGSAIPPPPDSTIGSAADTTIDRVNTRYLALDIYYDFINAWGELSPYLGAGAGRASVEVAGLHYSDQYFDTAGGEYNPPLSSYISVQNADLKGSVSMWRLHAGADYALGANTLLGLKLSWSTLGSYERAAPYETHPQHSMDPDFTNTNSFHGLHNFSVALTVRRWLGK